MAEVKQKCTESKTQNEGETAGSGRIWQDPAGSVRIQQDLAEPCRIGWLVDSGARLVMSGGGATGNRQTTGRRQEADSRQTVGRQHADYRQTSGRQDSDSRQTTRPQQIGLSRFPYAVCDTIIQRLGAVGQNKTRLDHVGLLSG